MTPLAHRLAPLQAGVALAGMLLWVPVEKLFMSEIGFTAASVGVMAAAYAAVVPLLEVPSGLLADRWSRSGVLVLATVALAASSFIGWLSHSVSTYVVAALVLGVYFALSSGTVDSIVYDTVLEETGSSDLYERWIGRVRIVESAGLVGSALLGGVLADLTSTRFTYLATVPVVLLAVVGFVLFKEPRLHRTDEPVSIRDQVSLMARSMTGRPEVRRALVLSAMAAMLAQSVFEFGPIWLVALAASPVLFGPYWAGLVATFGVGGWLAPRIDLDRRPVAVAVALASIAATSLLAVSDELAVVVVAQTAVALLLAVIGIHASKLLMTPSRRRSEPASPAPSAPCRGWCSCPEPASSAGSPEPTASARPAGRSPSRRRWSALSSCSRRSAGPRRSRNRSSSRRRPGDIACAPWWTWSPTTWTAFSTQSAGRRSSGTWPAATAVRPMWPRSARRSPPSRHFGQSSHQPRRRSQWAKTAFPSTPDRRLDTPATSSWHRDM